MSLPTAARSVETFGGEYCVLRLALPGRPVANIGVLLLDPSSRKLHIRLRESFADVANPEDAEVLSELRGDFARRLDGIDGEAFLLWLEETLSNALQLTERRTVMVRDFDRTLDRLFVEHVERKPAAIPYKNSLPLLSLPVAAGYLDRQVEISEAAAEWLLIPESLRPDPRKFIARIEGRSMEPKIPDGSLAVFRFGVVGSRMGKILMVELFDAVDPIARYTVKKYSSVKERFDDGTWQHRSIRLLPLNPEFQPIDVEEDGRFRVIAEFTGILGTED